MTYQQILDCRKIAEHYGYIAQLMQLLQEFAELQNLLCLRTGQRLAHKNYKQHVTEEIADCMIMLQQIAEMYGVGDDLNGQIDFKIKRTMEGILDERAL